MSLRIAEILNHFEEVKTYTGYWWARCPAHNDKSPSLKIRVDKDGICRFDCKAGCTRHSIVDAAGLTESDCGGHTLTNPSNSIGDFEDDYIYINIVDGQSVPYMKAERYRNPQTHKKEFKLYKWDSQRTEWIKGAPKDRIPYRLPELANALLQGKPIFIVEGEKCVDALRSIGIVATCNSEGSGKWLESHTSYLKGAKRIYIIPDNDQPGYDHMNKVGQSLKNAGIPISWFSLGVSTDKYDIADWIEQGHSAEELLVLVANAKTWDKPVRLLQSVPKTINAVDLMKKNFPPPRWAVPGMFPAGLIILAGKPKTRKSWMALGLCVSLATGGKAFSKEDVEQTGALYLALEDTEYRLQDRLGKVLQGSDKPTEPPSLLEFRTNWPRIDEGGMELLDDWLSEHPAVKFIVIDTLKRVKPIQKRSESYYDYDYDTVCSIKAIADKHNVTIMVIHHLRKAPSMEDPFDELSGSTGLSGAADTIAVLRRTKGDSEATLYIRGRDVEEQELAVSFNNRTYGWDVLGDAEEFERTDNQQAIIDVLKKTDAPLLPKDIARLTGLSDNYISKTLTKMHQAGKVISKGYKSGWLLSNRGKEEKNRKEEKEGKNGKDDINSSLSFPILPGGKNEREEREPSNDGTSRVILPILPTLPNDKHLDVAADSEREEWR